MSRPPASLPPLGGIEPHAGLLTLSTDEQLLYKIVTVENLLRSIDGGYLHFNRVDSYGDGPGADPHDGAQLPMDVPGNASAGFEQAPEFTAAHYYDRSRSRTYACCFSAEKEMRVSLSTIGLGAASRADAIRDSGTRFYAMPGVLNGARS
jgi:hypothetical protein